MNDFTGHTLGPWEVAEANLNIDYEWSVRVRDSKRVIADVWNAEGELPMNANAALISAAPRLARHRALLYNALRDFSRKGWLSPEAMVTSIHVLAEIDAEDKEAEA